MSEWLVDNWKWLATIIYGLERVTALVSELISKIKELMEVIENHHRLNGDAVKPSAKEMVPDKLKGDIILDTILDAIVDPRTTTNGNPNPRVSKKRQVGSILLRALPLVSRILKR